MAQECIIRPAASLGEAHSIWWPLMQSLGWNRASADCKTHYLSTTATTGESGWIVVAAKSTPGQAEGCIVPFVYLNGTGWVGFFILNSSFRGRGWGAKLFQAGLDHFKSNGATIVGLDAVQEQVGTYSRRGFVETDRIKIMVRKGLQELEFPGGLEHVEELNERCTLLSRIPSHILVESDLQHTGMARVGLWTKDALFDRDDIIGIALVKEGEKCELEGWILIRGCADGWRFGPLYANTQKHASFLLHTAMKRLEAEEGNFIAEVWGSNTAAVKVFEDAGWTYAMDYHRMWLDGKVPDAQKAGGKAETEMWAIFDAGEG